MANRVDIHQDVHKLIKPGGLIIFSALTADIPLPDHHATNSIKLPNFDSILSIFSDIRIISVGKGIIWDTHSPISPPHYHSIARVIARKNTDN